MTAHVTDKLSVATDASSAPISYAIEEIPAATGIPRTKVFQAARERRLIIRKYGRTSIVLRDDLIAFLKSLPVKGDASEMAA